MHLKCISYIIHFCGQIEIKLQKIICYHIYVVNPENQRKQQGLMRFSVINSTHKKKYIYIFIYFIFIFIFLNIYLYIYIFF